MPSQRNPYRSRIRWISRSLGPLLALAMLAASCSSEGSIEPTAAPDSEVDDTAAAEQTDDDTADDDTADDDTADDAAAVPEGCDAVAALFTVGESMNPDLAEPAASATCDGDSIVVTSNGIPAYTYIETSPGSPNEQDLSTTLPFVPVVAEETTSVALIGPIAITLSGLPIFGPTEGTGGDVLSLAGALSECGSHNGPTGFHLHLLGVSETTDCIFTPEEVAAAPQLLGYAFDGYPIYTGNDQFTSSWELTDASLFATETWAAHSYVEGLGDLDECNGRTDADGNYGYYTTDTFPYVLGCYRGVVELAGGGGGGGGERPGPPGGGGGEPPGNAEGGGQ